MKRMLPDQLRQGGGHRNAVVNECGFGKDVMIPQHFQLFMPDAYQLTDRRISFDFMNPFPGGEAVRPEDQADRIMPECFQILRIDAGLHDQDGDRFLYAEPPQGIG